MNREFSVFNFRKSTSQSFSLKVLWLLMIPLTVHAIFFAFLLMVLNQAQTISERQYQEQQLIGELDQVFIDRGNSFGGILERSLIPTNFPPEAELALKTKIAQNIFRVKQNPSLEPAIKASLNRIEETYDTQHSQLSNHLSKMNLFEKIELLESQTKDLQTFHDQIVTRLTEKQRAYAAERQTLRMFEVALVFGICANFAAALLALVMFNRKLDASLKMLTENSEKISSETALPNRLIGTDELVKIDQALHLSHTRLLEARQRRQAINAMIAHDVRTPLMAVALISRKFSKNLSADNDVSTEDIQRLKKNLSAIQDHVEELLMVEKLEAGKLELNLSEVKLKALLEAVSDSLADVAAEKDITIKLTAADCMVIGDPKRLSQVVQNLLSNALRHSPSGGQVILKLEVGLNTVCVLIQDFGPGIKNSEQSNLFNKFFQTNSTQNEKGFGLGLSICKQLVELHRGEIGVTSRPLNGSTFWFKLPLDDLT